MRFCRAPRRKFVRASIGAVLGAFTVQLAFGVDATWDKSGGTTWNGTAKNWKYAQVPAAAKWTNGSTAIFTGTAATIDLKSDLPITATGLTFKSAGFILQSEAQQQLGALLSVDFVVDAQADATVNFGIAATGEQSFWKIGSGILTLGGQLGSFGSVNINASELVISSSIYDGSKSIYSIGSGASLAFGSTATGTLGLGGLSGSGNLSVKQGAQLLNLGSDRDAIFSGTLSTLNSATLAITKLGAGKQEFETAQLFSGSLTVLGGTLSLAKAASLSLDKIVVRTGATLQFANSEATSSVNRIGDAATLSLNGGALKVTNTSTTACSETIGLLELTGMNFVEVQRDALIFTTTSFSSGAGIQFKITDGGLVKLSDKTTTNGILGAASTVLTPTGDNLDWATLDGSKNVIAYSAYKTSFTGQTTDNVKIQANTSTTAAISRNSLKLDASSGNVTLTLTSAADGPLALTSGGLLSAGANLSTISGGYLKPVALSKTATTADLVITNQNSLTISSSIINDSRTTVIGKQTIVTPITTSVIKNGAGELTLTGINTFTGNISVNQGVLAVSGGGRLAGKGTTPPGVTILEGATFLVDGSEKIGGLGGAGTVQLGTAGNSGTMEMEIGLAATNTAFEGAITGSGQLVKSGYGSFTLSAQSSFTGGLTVSGGTFSLGSATDLLAVDLLGGAPDLTLAGGTFGYADAALTVAKQSLGILTLNGSAELRFASSSATASPSSFSFLASNSASWIGHLTISGYVSDGYDKDVLRFGIDETGLTAAQLALIEFIDSQGNFSGAQIDHLGYVTPVPEPAACAMIAGMLAAAVPVAWRKRRIPLRASA